MQNKSLSTHNRLIGPVDVAFTTAAVFALRHIFVRTKKSAPYFSTTPITIGMVATASNSHRPSLSYLEIDSGNTRQATK